MDKKLIGNMVKNLIDSGNADIEPEKLFMPTLQVTDLWEKYDKYASRKCKKKINDITSNGLIYQYDRVQDGFFNKINHFVSNKLNTCLINKDVYYVRNLHIVNFMGIIVDSDDKEQEEAAVKKLIKELNFLAKKGYLVGNLQRLFRVPLAYGKTSIASYPLLNTAGHNYAQEKVKEENSIFIYEGAMPVKLEEL